MSDAKGSSHDRFYDRKNVARVNLHKMNTEPHSSVGSIASFRTGHWLDHHRLGQYSFQGLMIVIATGFIPLLPLSLCFDNGYVGKQPVALKENFAEYWLKELKESMDRLSGRRKRTKVLLKRSLTPFNQYITK